MPGQPVVILLVEDNPDHVLLMQEALKDNGLLNEIRVVKDGQEALDYLYHRGDYADPDKPPKPGLILLDMKVPKVDGLEVLRIIKSDPNLKSVPVIVLTTSAHAEDVKRAYELGANSYITKPVNFDDFITKVRTLKLYWMLVNTLPFPRE